MPGSRAARAFALPLLLVLAVAGCGEQPCTRNSDCPSDQVCGQAAACIFPPPPADDGGAVGQPSVDAGSGELPGDGGAGPAADAAAGSAEQTDAAPTEEPTDATRGPDRRRSS